MTNTLAIVIGCLVVTGLALDTLLNDGDNLLFLAKKFVDMTEWMAFWR